MRRVQQSEQGADCGRPRCSTARHIPDGGFVQTESVLDRVDTHGDELTRGRQRRVRCHPAAGLVHRRGELGDGVDGVCRLGVGAGS